MNAATKYGKKETTPFVFFAEDAFPPKKKNAPADSLRFATADAFFFFLLKSAEPPNGPARDPLQFSSVPATSASGASAFGAFAEAARRAARVSAA